MIALFKHEANICLPGSKCKLRFEFTNPLPSCILSTFQASIICIECSQCWVSEGNGASWGRLLSTSEQPAVVLISRASQLQCPGQETGSPPAPPAASVPDYLGATQTQFNLSGETEEAWNEVIDFPECFVLQCVCS